MNEVSVVGVDLAKRVFQVHGAAADVPMRYLPAPHHRCDVRRALERTEDAGFQIIAMEGALVPSRSRTTR